MVICLLSSVLGPLDVRTGTGTVWPGDGSVRPGAGSIQPGTVLGPYGREFGPCGRALYWDHTAESSDRAAGRCTGTIRLAVGTVRPGAVLGPYVLSTNGSTVTAFHCVVVGWNI